MGGWVGAFFVFVVRVVFWLFCCVCVCVCRRRVLCCSSFICCFFHNGSSFVPCSCRMFLCRACGLAKKFDSAICGFHIKFQPGSTRSLGARVQSDKE